MREVLGSYSSEELSIFQEPHKIFSKVICVDTYAFDGGIYRPQLFLFNLYLILLFYLDL